MVLVVEIMAGIISFLVGLFVILDAYKEYHRNEKYYVGDILGDVEYVLGFVLITIGFIVITSGVDNFYNLIYHILSMEVF